MTLALRPMTEADLPQVMAIERASFTQPWSEALFRAEIGNGAATCVVAVSGDAVAGYYAAATLIDETDLHVIAVDPARRRGGIARRLVAHLIDEARRREATRVHLEVRAGNEAARRLYESFGFRAVGRRPGYYQHPPEDAVLYTVEL